VHRQPSCKGSTYPCDGGKGLVLGNFKAKADKQNVKKKEKHEISLGIFTPHLLRQSVGSG
jgi:hypothetical protein